ncbi:hypothetical protein FSP39_025468 [Pinctada imbricata]|uniref:Uncharacterized protein n=1 Tax=Pinctada imbricata TaxID=66713 RepID=A0AA89BTR8_PINIB|nr:hypothetical protein FSP39_025468 [Pinctada imbricata]
MEELISYYTFRNEEFVSTALPLVLPAAVTTHHTNPGTTKPHLTTKHVTVTTKHHGHGHHTHAPREPSEQRSYSFYYDAYSHFMALKITVASKATCYIYFLNADERHTVHEKTGIYQIEGTILKLSLVKTDPFPYDDILLKTDPAGGFAKFCTRSTALIKLN